ncbi:hypothetical protein V9T40_014249 [Parthenolecanium corni]|uniref:Mannosyl-oligosaccharide glucosidase n=1 Tax=Parthenolecanium corni TaxID=536013 RepID=A0AAN9T4P9_9HEMI
MKSSNKRQSVNDNDRDQQEDNSSFVLSFRTFIPAFCLVLAICIGYKGYLETRINTPFDKVKIVQKTGLAVPDRYWGSYRPNLYFGMKTRDAYSLVTGIMWYYPARTQRAEDIRHWCEQSGYLKGYSWTEHDGRNFGVQTINDDYVLINTSFVKKLRGSYGGDWTSRISFDSKKKKRIGETVSLLLYTTIENQTSGYIRPEYYDIVGVTGYTEGLGEFKIKISNITQSISHQSHLFTKCSGLNVIKETILSSFRLLQTDTERLFTFVNDLATVNVQSNLVVTQLTLRIPFEVDVIFESSSAIRQEQLTGNVYSTELNKHLKLFNDKFENTFKLSHKGFNASEIAFAKAAFSNLIGGIGYFYGSSRVLSEHTDSPVPYWKAALYTAVPSRSFFPRGFLWDEGFHGLLLSVWDLDIELDIISHWFDLMNVEGWIPREQILGAEALSRVPPEFVTQINTNANPPAFFLTLQFILKNFEEQLIEQATRLETLDRLYNRLVAWFDWFNTTQTGTLPGTYRWRGRDANTTRELNPKTLTSGFDDYPRASHPTDEERHVDLRCWIAHSAATIVSISNLLNKPSNRFLETATYLYDNEFLDKYHWSEKEGIYADYGLHSDDIILTYVQNKPHTNRRMERRVLKPPTYRLVDKTFGYNNLFPFILHIVDPNSPKLEKILTKIRDPQLLWTEFGLRSLSKSSPLYMKPNTEDDPPYWRGSVWINMNYLIVRALKHYSTVLGPYSKKAESLYHELRKNVISNVYKEYKRTGYVWEHYNDLTGEGEGARPFTGWTSLVVLIMAEIF